MSTHTADSLELLLSSDRLTHHDTILIRDAVFKLRMQDRMLKEMQSKLREQIVEDGKALDPRIGVVQNGALELFVANAPDGTRLTSLSAELLVAMLKVHDAKPA